MKLELIRNVTQRECCWLNRDFEKGEIVYKYTDHTYGCVSGSGIACSIKDGKDPFFELPKNSVLAVKGKDGRIPNEKIKDYGQSDIKAAKNHISAEREKNAVRNSTIYIMHLEGQAAVDIAKIVNLTTSEVGKIISNEASDTAEKIRKRMSKIEEYPLTEEECFKGPLPKFKMDELNEQKSELIQQLARDLNPNMVRHSEFISGGTPIERIKKDLEKIKKVLDNIEFSIAIHEYHYKKKK